MRVLILLLSLVIVSCEKKSTAESKLKEFIRLRYKGEQKKSEILPWLTDPIYTEFNDIHPGRDKGFEVCRGEF